MARLVGGKRYAGVGLSRQSLRCFLQVPLPAEAESLIRGYAYAGIARAGIGITHRRGGDAKQLVLNRILELYFRPRRMAAITRGLRRPDRKSTRLNSSH